MKVSIPQLPKRLSWPSTLPGNCGSGWLPQTVVLDPNGGIVFEQRKRETAEVYHVWDDGTVEFQRYQGSRLVGRWPV